MLGRKTTMSIKEFCELQRGELSLSEIRERRRLEKRLNDNKRHLINDFFGAESSALACLTLALQHLQGSFIPAFAYIPEAVRPKGLAFFFNNFITNIVPISMSVIVLMTIYQILDAKDEEEVRRALFRCVVVLIAVYFLPKALAYNSHTVWHILNGK